MAGLLKMLIFLSIIAVIAGILTSLVMIFTCIIIINCKFQFII